MILRDVAEGAVLVEYPEASEEEANQRAVAVARSLTTRAPAGFFDAVPGARSLLVLFDPGKLARRRLAQEIRSGAGEGRGAMDVQRALEIPVLYDAEPGTGPDLEELSRGAGLTREEFAGRHAQARYRVAFLGFAPGFPYMTGLPEELHAPRLATPRTRVPAGSVGIGGTYTGIYPEETPGGWRLIGRAPVRLFNAGRNPPALLLPGDSVRFQPIGREEFERRRLVLERADPAEGPGASALSLFRVTAPGVFTSVQGGPRRGWAVYGAPPGGAMDLEALAGGNAAVGNPPSAPALEMTLVGPELEVLAEASVALSGTWLEPEVNGRPVAAGALRRVRIGDRLRLGPLGGGMRAYLCVAGGLARTGQPHSSRRLVSGELVFAAPPRAQSMGTAVPALRPAQAGKEVVIRVLPGPQRDYFENEGLAAFLDNRFRVSAASDRRGVRLEGPAIAARRSPDIPPEGTALGGIQVPGDGQPIILGPDRPITGGYAKIATVIEADFPLVAQALPGTLLRFAEVTLADALAARVRIT
ncbi:MAG TPA: 5-oxoprolinase subunit PxpB [Thermoanaerobaculia bacterium]|nr:5-oxoprolinase subunit PxpB [Thermoanaerobaculia bacterium]